MRPSGTQTAVVSVLVCNQRLVVCMTARCPEAHTPHDAKPGLEEQPTTVQGRDTWRRIFCAEHACAGNALCSTQHMVPACSTRAVARCQTTKLQGFRSEAAP